MSRRGTFVPRELEGIDLAAPAFRPRSQTVVTGFEWIREDASGSAGAAVGGSDFPLVDSCAVNFPAAALRYPSINWLLTRGRANTRDNGSEEAETIRCSPLTWHRRSGGKSLARFGRFNLSEGANRREDPASF